MHKVLLMIVLFTMVLLTSPVMAETPPPNDDGSDQWLSTTLLGKLEPGGEPRLAVRWDGPDTEWLDVWVDFDGDGVVGPGELVISGRLMEHGIEVIELEIPSEFYDVDQPRLSVRTLNSESAGWDGGLKTGASGKAAAECGWQPGFEVDDLNRLVLAFAVFDDGTGPALYAGGEFTLAGPARVNYIAKWDGMSWSALGGLLDAGPNTDVNALAVFDDGGGEALYVGGDFTTVDGITVNHIAKWDGTTWSALSGPSGTGVNSSVFALAVYDDSEGEALYAGGYFHTAGGITVNHVAKWDGTTWSALSGPSDTGMDHQVYSLTVFDDGGGQGLYAGGFFNTAGGVDVHHIAKWDGVAWSSLDGPLGTGVYGSVNALAAINDGPRKGLYVTAGIAGGVETNGVAKWDGKEWSAVTGPPGTGFNWPIYALTVFDDGGGETLYAGGYFTVIDGVVVNRIAKWDGTSWSALSGPSDTGMNDEVRAFSVFDDGTGVALYAGGEFTTVGGVAANRIAKWNGTALSAIAEPSGAGINDPVYALAVFDDSSGSALFAGGNFTFAGAVSVDSIARWDGTSWSALTGSSGVGVSGWVNAMVVYDDGEGEALFVGGGFVIAGGITVHGIAKWDGTSWSALTGPSGTGAGTVYSLAVYDDGTGEALFAAGYFNTAGGVDVHHIAKWDGVVWSALSGSSGVGVSSWVKSLAVYDDGGGEALYVGGGFTTAGGVTTNYIAKWDGTTWSPLSGLSESGMDSYVYALAAYDDGGGEALYAGGYFTTAGGVAANHTAKWDGKSWSALGGPSGEGMDSDVVALVVYDDGGGRVLFAGGYFSTAGGLTARHIAKWDGTVWSALDGPLRDGMNWDVLALAIYDDGMGDALYAGGYFNYAGGLHSNRIAKWMCNYRIFTDGFESGDTSGWSTTQP